LLNGSGLSYFTGGLLALVLLLLPIPDIIQGPANCTTTNNAKAARKQPLALKVIQQGCTYACQLKHCRQWDEFVI